MKRRTEITIEVDRVTVISHSRNHRPSCASCGTEVLMVTACEAADLIDASESSIYWLAESGKLHFATTTEGRLIVCPDSLLACLKRERATRSSSPSTGDAGWHG